MNLVKAIIRVQWLSECRSALERVAIEGSGISWLSLTEVKGFGRQGGAVEYYRGVKFEHDFMAKLALEMFVPDEQLDAVLGAIVDAANTGYEGDGKVFVLRV